MNPYLMNPYHSLVQQVIKEPLPKIQLRKNVTFGEEQKPKVELTKGTKFKRLIYLGVLGTTFGITKYYISKYEKELEGGYDPELTDIEVLLPATKKALIPTTTLLAVPSFMVLVSKSEWKRLTYLCYFTGLGIALKELLPPLYKIFREDAKEVAVKRKNTLLDKISRQKDYLEYFD